MTETAKPPSGRTILKAIREELLLNLYPLPFSTLPVTIYHVYLCPRDYAVIEGVVPRIVEQIERALTAEVQRFNAKLDRSRARVLTRLLERNEPLAPIELPASGWEVRIQPDPDGELKPGQLGIVSTLSIANAAEYGGTPTTKIVKSVVTGGRRTATSSVVHQTGRGTTPSEPVPESNERARLTYEDEQGRHVFSMRKDALSVGRGGSAAWVDVQVITTAKVSREHFRIRRDPGGRFFIQDVSSWGTSVDGAPVPPAIKSTEGVLQPGPEQELPASARIALADAMEMQFEAANRR
jgi:FHA domain